MLTRLHVRSFKALADAEIRLRPFTALIGPNGAGKSTVLQAIELMGSLVSSNISTHLESHHWEYADLPHLRAVNSRILFEAELALAGRLLRWTVELGARRFPGVAGERIVDLSDGRRILLERKWRSMARLNERTRGYEHIDQTLTSSWLSAVEESDEKRFPALVAIARWARGIRGYFFLDPVALRSPARGSPQDVGRHGEALAAFLGKLARKDRKAFDRVVERVRRQYPRLVTVRPKSTRYGWTQLEITERWNSEEATFNARQVSDGLLRLLAVASMHEVPSAPSVLLLDEVENGLHPHLLEGFVGLLRQYVEEKPGTQVIFTTHSPITVNYCGDAKNVLLVDRAANGHPRFTPMDETKNFEVLRQHFDLGELWYNVGERKLRP